MALALPAVFVACQDQDVVSTPNGSVEGQFVNLGKGFTLIGGTENDATTRGQWTSGDDGVRFVWQPVATTAGGTTYTPDQIGLAWTGVCLDKEGNVNVDGSAVTAVDDRVFTNYKFSHFGWKINGTEPTVDECTGELKAGTFAPVNGYTDQTNTLAGAYSTTTGDMEYAATPGAITAWPGYTKTDGETNGSEGLFNTNNSTVYAGKYIVYSPYDAKNTSNYIIATSKEEFAISDFQAEATRAKTMEEFTNEIFKYGFTTIQEGGDRTTKFATENLNGYVGIKLKSKSGDNTIKKVILYDATGKNLLTKVGLSAKGIYAGQSGKNLYMDNAKVTKEYTETITATIGGGNGTAVADDAYSYITIPVLPTEAAISSLKVILINENNLAVETEIKNITIERNAYATGSWIDFKDIDFTNAPYLATDLTSLDAAVRAANVSDNSAKDMSIRLLGNATLTADYTLPTMAAKSITIEGGKIIVPDAAGSSASDAIVLSVGDGYTINSNIDVLQSCCKDFGGELAVTGAATLGGVINIGAAEAVEDAAHEAKLNFNGEKTVSTLTGTINNYGKAVIAKATTTDAASHQVTVDGGTINNYDSFVIETTGDVKKQDAKLFVETGALNNAESAEMTVAGVLAVGNSATASNNGIVVDKISSQVTGNIQKLGVAPGQYVSEVDNPGNRFEAALYYRPTTTVRFVNTDSSDKPYDLNKLNDSKLKASITTYEVNAAKAITFNSGANTDIAVKMKNLIVKSALGVTAAKDGKTNYMTLAVENLNVEAAVTFSDVADNTKAILKGTNVTVKAGGSVAMGKFNRSEIATLLVNANEGQKNAGAITFNFSSQTLISKNITVNGTADILQATGSTSTDVAGDVWLLEGATSVGDGNWLHGIPTPWAN